MEKCNPCYHMNVFKSVNHHFFINLYLILVNDEYNSNLRSILMVIVLLKTIYNVEVTHPIYESSELKNLIKTIVK